MAQIVGIHGIAQQYGGRFSLEQVWLTSLRDGLAAADYHAIAEGMTERHLQVAFFGDLFRPLGAMGAADFQYSTSSLKSDVELGLLSELYWAATGGDMRSVGERSPVEPMTGGRVAVQAMVEHLLRTKTFAGIAKHALVGSLKQVALFLADQSTKERVIGNVRDAVRDDTRVVIGHSMGSIVAYEYLCRHRPPGVQLLVTLGSPLGIRNLIFDRLAPPPVAGVGTWPGEVPAWVNVADPNDFVALRKKLSGLWPSGAAGRGIVDREVDNGDRPHSAARYLNSRQTGATLGDVLG
jgi:pimeloyl-ACP methyl ester carboxylesterase